MIRYTLACAAGHRFDSWFANSQAYDDLASKELIECAVCGSRTVEKAIMAPALIARSPVPLPATEPQAPAANAPAPFVAEGPTRELRALFRAAREMVLAQTDNVGSRFSDEVRRMHDGDVPQRGVRGEATLSEARALLEDGIAIMPLPPALDEMN